MRQVTLFLMCIATSSAIAQRADDNAVTAAEDAFGATLGEESIGLYSTSLVRGFSPVTAGNVRIEGLYFDRQASLPNRLVEGSMIRVGLSAQGYPFPAPTGIVDYRLHKAGDELVVSVAGGIDPYVSPLIEIDAKVRSFPSNSRSLVDSRTTTRSTTTAPMPTTGAWQSFPDGDQRSPSRSCRSGDLREVATRRSRPRLSLPDPIRHRRLNDEGTSANRGPTTKPMQSRTAR